MKLETHCQNCGKPLTFALSDEMTEAEASNLARLILCEPCGLRAAIAQSVNQPGVAGKESFFGKLLARGNGDFRRKATRLIFQF